MKEKIFKKIKKLGVFLFLKRIKIAKIILICAAVVFAGYAIHFGIEAFLNSKIEKIGWVSDIHADRFKRRDVDSGLLRPKKYKEYLPKVFDAMRAEGINVVIATGDNTNSGDEKYAEDIERIAKEKKMKVIWVRGNHDNDGVMKILGVNKKQYYFQDINNTRIIVLDSTEYPNGEYDYSGGISQEQLEWLKKVVKTKKQVVIAMHIPIFEEDIASVNIHDLKGNFSGVGDILERYAELEKILRENNNVKIVFSGHWHVSWQKEYNGIKYYGESALTRDGEEGAYATINLKNNQVDYKFAK